MDRRPVLYLDLDDTLVSWDGGQPHAAPGAAEFVLWALSHFELRWLTTWCPSGVMDGSLLLDLARMLELPSTLFRDIEGLDWDSTGSKLNGIAWLEHTVSGRPFVWLEDDYGVGQFERDFLAKHGYLSCYRHCNVTQNAQSLNRARAFLQNWLTSRAGAAA